MKHILVFSLLLVSSCLAQAKSYKLELRFEFSPPTVAKDSYTGPITGHEAVFVNIEAPNLLQAQQQVKDKVGTSYNKDFEVALDPKSPLCKCENFDDKGICKAGDKVKDDVAYKNIKVSQRFGKPEPRCDAVISSAKIVGIDLYESSGPICHVGDSQTTGVALCGSKSKDKSKAPGAEQTR